MNQLLHPYTGPNLKTLHFQFAKELLKEKKKN